MLGGLGMGGKGDAIVGALFFFGGLIITLVTYSSAEGGGSYVVAWGAILFGFIQMVRGLSNIDSGGEFDEPAYQHAGSGAPAQLIEGYLTAEDYPSRALRDEIEGTTIVGFTVDEAGNVGGVHVSTSSGDQSLDDASCKAVAERFRYEPARNASGHPVAEHRTQPIRWAVPRD